MASTEPNYSFFSSYGITKMKAKASQSYFNLGLFFILTLLFGYFIAQIIVSLSGVYSDYLNLSRRTQNAKTAVKIPGVGSGLDPTGDDLDYSTPLDGRFDADRMNYNDTIQNQIGILDVGVEDPTSGAMKSLISLRQKNSVTNGGTPYHYSASIGTNVISPQFDDYVYQAPRPGEKSFFEYLFSP
jgi:hypothetical protein